MAMVLTVDECPQTRIPAVEETVILMAATTMSKTSAERRRNALTFLESRLK
jgi:hypothetical protein